MKMFGGSARMFPRAPLWLSTGLEIKNAFQSFFDGNIDRGS